ncbi:helix-turn-helix domain-containing protein [Paenibacillus sp. BAC0078]
MFDLSELYYPITSNPAAAGEYLPCKALRPYIRCFWGSASRKQAHAPLPQTPLDGAALQSAGPETIIPDTCMDIIWEWDAATGEAGGIFCGINDTPFEAGGAAQSNGKLIFAIRFHFWAVHLFADEHLRDVLNVHVPAEQYFVSFREELGQRLHALHTFSERAAAAEAYLLRRLDNSWRSNNSLMNAVYSILKQKGVVTAGELENNAGISSRQLERLFREYIGLSPKKTADLVRFQNVWLDLYQASPHKMVMQDVVYNYRYSHQSHLINSFKKFAGRTPLEALAHARR